MITLIYKPFEDDFLYDPAPVRELKMELTDDISWVEGTQEFQNFLRAVGYKIPYSPLDNHPVFNAWNEVNTGPQKDKKREWVGLTEDEIEKISDRIKGDELLVETSTWHIRFAEAIERNLRKKNA